MLPAKRWEKNCTGSYFRGLKNQIVEHFINLRESNILETHAIFPCELVRNLFPVKSTNSTKIKITHYRVIGDGCIWKGMSLMTAFSESVS